MTAVLCNVLIDVLQRMCVIPLPTDCCVLMQHTISLPSPIRYRAHPGRHGCPQMTTNSSIFPRVYYYLETQACMGRAAWHSTSSITPGGRRGNGLASLSPRALTRSSVLAAD